jgi:hypothetical protein
MSIVHFHLVLTWDIVSLSAVEGGLTKARCKETCFNGIIPPCFDFAQHDMSIVHSHLVLTWDIVSLSEVEGGLTKARCKETCFKGHHPAMLRLRSA